MSSRSRPLSLFHLLDPEILADPYPLYAQLRTESPVHWDPYLHAWVVTRYADVSTVLSRFLADRTPTPDKLTALGMERLTPVANVMVRQMLFLDPPQHTRIRSLAAAAFTARRVERLRSHIQDITDTLIDGVVADDAMDLMAALANPLPAIVTAEMLGVPTSDHEQLKDWSQTFAEMLGNFQHNPDRVEHVVRSVNDMTTYFHAAIGRAREQRTDGLISAFLEAEVDGDRLTDEEIVANVIVTMVGGQETTTNLIGNGMLSLLRHPAVLEQVRNDAATIPSAVEEMLRYESPSQHTARIAPADLVMGDQTISKGQAVIAVMGAANRDPERFPDPDRLDPLRADNRHLAFGWSSHFCFGAPLARMEAQVAFETVLRRLPDLRLVPEPVAWRPNLGLRGLTALPVTWST
jgi:cytochrome P450